MSPEPIIAAGCLVTRGEGDDLEVLVVHRPKYDDWSLPKGKQEAGEHVTATAVREVAEETGVHVALRQPLPSRKYKVSGRPKTVHYWRAEVEADKGFAPNSEVDQIAWLSPKAARKQLTHPLDSELATLATEPVSTPFVVLRHGHARKRVDWSGDDEHRPLDALGEAQADELVPRLAVYGITRIHTSKATRCAQTVSPFADFAGLPVALEAGLTEQAYEVEPKAARARVAGLLADAVRNHDPTVLCGHRPYLIELLDHLLTGSKLTGPQDTVPVGSMIVLHGCLTEATLRISAIEHHVLD